MRAKVEADNSLLGELSRELGSFEDRVHFNTVDTRWIGRYSIMVKMTI